MVEQRGMLNHLYAKIEALELSAADTVAQTASQCFDISVWQFLAALLVGGRVQIYPDVIAHDALRLLQLVEQQQVSILETVPSLLRAMLDAQEDKEGQQPQLKTLRWLIPTGEALPVELCRRWLQRYPHIPMLNAYGPTECSDDVTHYIIREPPPPHQRSIPIGRAIRNTQLYVLDQHRQPLPMGVSGELYVGGIGVGRGYLGDEQRTAEAFIADPFVSEEGARLYKTGDLARYLPDGNLEFIGRMDTQVKLRGYRIELGEIEAVLNQQEEIREAVVAVREAEKGDKRLVAYVVLQPGRAIRNEELKRLIKQRMPSYMVPAAFVQLEKLPLTSNGKLDRAALPVPEWSRETEESYVAPVLPLHQRLVSIWEEVLGVRPIGIKDDFFELGGDSLLAVQLFERIEQECGKMLGLATLFAGATIEQMAAALGEEAQLQTRTPLVTVQAGGSRTPFFFLHGEWKGGALYTLELAHHLGAEQPFYLLPPYKFDGLVVPPTFEAMAVAHLATLRQVQPEGPYLLGGYCNGALMAYEMARQLHAQGQTIDLLLLIDPDAPARHRWVRSSISRICNLMRISQERQFAWFLCLQHVYRYLRFPHYRQSQNAELLAASEQDGLGHRPGNISSVPSDVRLKALVPKVEALRQNSLNVYDWPASDYAPDLYAGKITFFWTSEEPWRPVGWQKVVKAKGSKVEIHMLPGNHITSRTEHLPVLAECLRVCLSKAQAIAKKE
jgi:acyl carrier protein